MSRIISGKLHLEKRPVDVADAVREAVRIVGGDADAKGQKLIVETPGAPYRALGDVARLQQVFWNLLRNSIKFSPERSTIAIRARVEPRASTGQAPGAGPGPEPVPGDNQADAVLVVEVVDQGCGIPPDMLPRLFNAFEQDVRARSFGGLGLGLSICKAVVEMHGGTIEAHSQGRGTGATFTIRLPVGECGLLSGGPGTHDSAGDAAPRETRNQSRLRVLLVEDHPDTAKVMRRVLVAQGHEVVVAGSVGEGMSIMDNWLPEVLISDLGLPDGSGVDLLGQLRAQGHDFPAIALSGYGSPADMSRTAAAGFVEHLVKPLANMDLLTDALARVSLRRR